MAEKKFYAIMVNLQNRVEESDETEEKRINNILAKSDPSLLCVPPKWKMTIYFTSAVEALKVTHYLKTNDNNIDYRIFPTSIETLNRRKSIVDKDKEFQTKHPRMYRKIANYKIYNSAQEYIESINSKPIIADEYDLTK